MILERQLPDAPAGGGENRVRHRGGGGGRAWFADSAWRATLVQLYSFSKAYCIPGHRMGALVAGTPFVGQIAKILDCIQICPGRAPQRALVSELGRIREYELDAPPDPAADAQLAGRIYVWFETATLAR